MVELTKIVEAVQGLIGERFPGEEVHTGRVPSGFTRPSFLVELGPVELADASCGCLELKVAVKATAFVEADEYGNSHVPELLRRMAALQELFAAEGLRVEDRVLSLQKSVGNCQFDYAEVTATLQYQDDRPGEKDWPLMGDIRTKIKEVF